MREKTQVVIKGVTINADDTVYIKFRKMEQIMEHARQTMRARDIVDHYELSDHMTTFLQGQGHFKVSFVNPKDGYLKLCKERDPNSRKRKQTGGTQIEEFEEIVILDHNNDNCDWTLNDVLIEEIRVDNDAAETYFSEAHQLSLAILGGKLFVNGRPITKTDSKIFEMFEKVMADAAISELLDKTSEHEDDF